MDYRQALAQAETGKALLVANTGGWKRWARFEAYPDQTVDASIFGVRIIRWYADGTIRLWMGGHNTATTREVMSNLLSPRMRVGNVDWKPRVWLDGDWDHPLDFVEGMTIEPKEGR